MNEHARAEQLQRIADGEPVDAVVRRHLDMCGECARQLAEISDAGEAYRSYFEEMKAVDPAPPRDWEDLRPRMTARRTPWRAWAAVAATVVVGFAAYYRMNLPPAVSAAELLRKAAAAEKPGAGARRIRVKTSKREIVRAAFVAGGVSSELESMFLAARFSWQEPLSARSFAAWHDGLAEKRDTVREEGGGYEIETKTTDGPLHSATIVLDAELRPVRETLEFAAERVEIAEVEAEPGAPAGVRSTGVRAPEPHQPAQSGPATELRAIAALHAIGADLGEPVQVTRAEQVVVTATGLTEARERQVREAVAAIPGVVYRAGETPVADSRGSASAEPVRPTPSQLAGMLGEDGVNRILDASEAVMARAFALRGLSRRFPHVVEAELADADRDVLASIRGEHVAGIQRHLRALEGSLSPLLTKGAATSIAPAVDWQAKAERLFAAAQAVDHLLNQVLAGGQDHAKAGPELSAALARLEAEARQ